MKENKITGGIILFNDIHNKKDTASSRIRGDWLIKYWDGLESYVYGKRYSFLIFQKAYITEYIKCYDGIKILDLCDPDWRNLDPIVEIIQEVDAVTVSSEQLQKTVQTFTDKPVVFIPDRQDLEYFKERKIHKGKAKEVCWYGYSHNAHVLKAIKPYLVKYDLGISIISDEPIILSDDQYKLKELFTKWKLETVNSEIIKSDIVIIPGSKNPNSRFKSDNRTTNAWALGMPVATSIEELERFLDPLERQKETDEKLKLVKEKFDVRQSVEEYKQLIERIQNDKTN